jgi:hypothetical protein
MVTSNSGQFLTELPLSFRQISPNHIDRVPQAQANRSKMRLQIGQGHKHLGIDLKDCVYHIGIIVMPIFDNLGLIDVKLVPNGYCFGR